MLLSSSDGCCLDGLLGAILLRAAMVAGCGTAAPNSIYVVLELTKWV